MRYFFLLSAIILSGCDNSPGTLEDFNDDLLRTLQNKPTDLGKPAMLMKSGSAEGDWLATIHGYPNNLEVCEQLIEPYNSDPSMSVIPGQYFCREV